MAILGMDMYGLALADLISNAVAVGSLEEVEKLLDAGRLPVFLPSRLMFEEDPLENSWDVTSDSIAAYIAGKLKAQKLLLIKCVDGIFDSDQKTNPKAKLVREISAQQLSSMKKETSVDVFLARLLGDLKVSCWVVNGLFSERVKAILDGEKAVCTLIKT